MVKALLFDLDETLYDEKQYRRSGLKAVANWITSSGLSNVSDFEERLVAIAEEKGWRYKNLFQTALAEVGLSPSLGEKLVEVYRSHEPDIALYDDAEAFLTDVHGKYRLGVLTEGVDHIQEAKVRALGLNRWFSPDAIVITGKLPNTPSKLQPEPFLEAARRLECVGANCLYVGDNPARDFRYPNEFGWQTIRLLRGTHSKDDGPIEAQETIHNYSELAALLKAMEGF